MKVVPALSRTCLILCATWELLAPHLSRHSHGMAKRAETTSGAATKSAATALITCRGCSKGVTCTQGVHTLAMLQPGRSCARFANAALLRVAAATAWLPCRCGR